MPCLIYSHVRYSLILKLIISPVQLTAMVVFPKLIMQFSNNTTSSFSSLSQRIDHGNVSAAAGIAMSADTSRTKQMCLLLFLPTWLVLQTHRIPPNCMHFNNYTCSTFINHLKGTYAPSKPSSIYLMIGLEILLLFSVPKRAS